MMTDEAARFAKIDAQRHAIFRASAKAKKARRSRRVAWKIAALIVAIIIVWRMT